MLTDEDINEEVQVFKRSWESLNRMQGRLRSLTYPEDPSSLPKAVFDRAYRAEDPPMGKDIRAGVWLAHIPMRSTSKLLKKNRKGRLPRPDGKAVCEEQGRGVPKPHGPVLRATGKNAGPGLRSECRPGWGSKAAAACCRHQYLAKEDCFPCFVFHLFCVFTSGPLDDPPSQEAG